ncbi:high mobility group nucleosome-binding domain-containing protein 5 isoform X3 [Coregonus clupeaformis]|uniref:high mobility group nucleosome-binding domain-containing protein 5 isoform X3 n=1 Tax=Coregonus clupeaformis TaxID=59861 RepID=UPI001BE0121F|nr:high mobility group nucleosome-binding domain-containing protein 5 isoform X3 [Coregonus clupeaformis]
MRVGVPIFLFLAAAGFHTALAASLESAEKEDTFGEEVGLEQLSDLQKRDQEEFEAAQMSEDAQSEDVHYLEAVQDQHTEEKNDTHEEDMADRDRDRNVETDQHESESDENVDGMRHKREHLEANVEEADEMANMSSLRTKPETKLR